MVRSEDDEEELRDFDKGRDASAIENDLIALPTMTPTEIFKAEHRAGLHSIEALNTFNQRIENLRVEGIARGGLHCCGAKGLWHNAWCWTGPTRPEDT